MVGLGTFFFVAVLLHIGLLIALAGRLATADSNRRINARVPQVWSRKGSKEQDYLYDWIFSAKYRALKDGVVSAIIWPLRLTVVVIWLIALAIASSVALRFFEVAAHHSAF